MAELWDDSALITAFNSAIAKYKDMHGLSGKSKTVGQKITQGGDVVSLESRSHVVETADQYGVEKGEVLQKEEISLEASQQEHEAPPIEANNNNMHGGGPFLSHEGTEYSADWHELERQQLTLQLHQLADQQQKLEQRLNDLGNNSLEEGTTTTACNNYAGSEYYAHQAYPAMAENCYQCQWNSYYNSSGAWPPSEASWSSRLQCQHCGFLNKYQESTNKPYETSNVSKTFPDVSAFPEIVRTAVAEAMKAAEAQKLTGEMKESSHAGFSDVAVAWFLAGFHTSRYLSQGGESQ